MSEILNYLVSIFEQKEKDYEQDESQPKSFKLRNKRVLFTYKDHIPKQDLLNWLSQCIDIDLHHIWHETSIKGYLHTHCQLRFKTQPNISNCRKFDYGDLHCNIKCINTDAHWKNVCNYNHTKDGQPADPEPLVNFDTSQCVGNLAPMIARIQKKRSFAEVLTSEDTCTFAKDHMSYTESVFNCKKLEPYEWPHDAFLPYQHFCLDLVKETGDRYIHWFWSHQGSVHGKSEFADWLCANSNGFPFNISTTYNDACYGMSQDPSSNFCVWDFDRSVTAGQIDYSILEKFKKRIKFCGKYKSKRVQSELPVIIVFANVPPLDHLLLPHVKRFIVYDLDNEYQHYQKLCPKCRKRDCGPGSYGGLCVHASPEEIYEYEQACNAK